LDNSNNYVEALDTRNGSIANASDNFYPVANGGLCFHCLIALPEDDAFVVTGVKVSVKNQFKKY
jgi:hypothetical protein